MTAPDAIDISDNNGSVDIAAVAASGVKLIVSKCSEGDGNQHPGFAANWAACHVEIATGRLARRGAYHFARADVLPASNADHALENTGPLTGDDFVALDCEAPSRDQAWAQPPGEASIQWVLATLTELELRAGGRIPWLYCSLGFLQGVLHNDPRLRAFHLWIADINQISRVPTPWPYALWQFSWTGRVPGVAGDVDCSRFGPAYESTLHTPTTGEPVVPTSQQFVKALPRGRGFVRLYRDGHVSPIAAPGGASPQLPNPPDVHHLKPELAAQVLRDHPTFCDITDRVDDNGEGYVIWSDDGHPFEF